MSERCATHGIRKETVHTHDFPVRLCPKCEAERDRARTDGGEELCQ
ncbi:hypothetical protein [Haloarchaeobius sp. DT45]